MSSEPRLPRVVGAVPVTPEQRDADEWVEEAIRETLARVRELAGKWGTTVTALTGLFGVGSLIDGDDAIRALPASWRIAYGVVSLAALVAAAGSITWAATAAQATVGLVGPDLAERTGEQARRTTAALGRLARSRIAAGAALTFGVVALAIRWYAPT